MLCGLALLACLAAFAWTWRQQAGIRQIRQHSVAPSLAGAAYEPATFKESARPTTAWPNPRAQSSGGEWVFELFSPPVIYRDAGTRSLAITRPGPMMDERDGGSGLELLEVRREPYRLQLAGYFGGPNDYLAAFVSHQLPGTLLGRAGKRFEQLRLTLRSFEVKRVEVTAHEDGGSVQEVAAQAMVFDETTGTEVLLDSRGRRFTDTPLAVLRWGAVPGTVHTLRTGEEISAGAAAYRVHSIQLDPPEVVLTRVSAGTSRPEIRVLRPAGRGGEVTDRRVRPKSFPVPSLAGLAATAPGSQSSP